MCIYTLIAFGKGIYSIEAKGNSLNLERLRLLAPLKRIERLTKKEKYWLVVFSQLKWKEKTRQEEIMGKRECVRVCFWSDFIFWMYFSFLFGIQQRRKMNCGESQERKRKR